tara:strand:- start:4117 stop:4782 length:666 start_codon:yes stop_codon:yes gene_type:complete
MFETTSHKIFKFNLLNNEECNFIKNYILDKERNVKALGEDIYPSTNNRDSLTGRYKIFNWLYTPIGNILLPKLKKTFDSMNFEYPVFIQCWANTFRESEHIKAHMHGMGFYSANILISGNNTLGRYKTSGLPFDDDGFTHELHDVGDMLLFGSDVQHYTVNNPDDDVRITVAMDIYPKQSMDKVPGTYFKELKGNPRRYFELQQNGKTDDVPEFYDNLYWL